MLVSVIKCNKGKIIISNAQNSSVSGIYKARFKAGIRWRRTPAAIQPCKGPTLA